MKKLSLIALLILALPATMYAARLQCIMPPDLSEARLLSGGTVAVLKHYRDQSDAEFRKLRAEYQMDILEDQAKKAEALINEKKQVYDGKVAELRKNYLTMLEITIHSSQAAINPSTSALGDVTYFYTAKNNTDRIITDITYKPLIDGNGLPTTTSLILEFIDPQTLKSGLGPHETITNLGHDAEKFSFFIGEIPQEELKKMRSAFGKAFSINLTDMHFSTQKGYKGEIKPQTFGEAFSGQLRPLQIAVEQAEADAKAKRGTYSSAVKEFTARQTKTNSFLKKSLDDLKASSVRYSAKPDKKGRYIFGDVAPGDYVIYASNGKGKAVFETITIGDKKQKETYTQMKKDPFVP
jgi:hypothetical protein